MYDNIFKLFINPPKEYGEVAFFWWVGEKLTKERLSWQLDRLTGMDICGLQVNYAHTDQGGNIYGLPFKSDPPLFSNEWWELFNWFVQEAKKRSITVSLSDYTLGVPGQGWFIDELLRKYPQCHGRELISEKFSVSTGDVFEYVISENTISVIAYKPLNNEPFHQSYKNLLENVTSNKIHFEVPKGNWNIFVISSKINLNSWDPMNPLSGDGMIEFFYNKFEENIPGEAGKGLNFFFSDELTFNVSGNLWNDRYAKEFALRKGYDIIPLLPAIFEDIGPITQKIKLDYYDIIVQLEEEALFRPVYEWHQKRGMTYGCDHGGRGLDIVEFGDYFRIIKYNQGPGCDQPYLQSDVNKNKINSSISHMYERPRTWLEGFHSSGWGTSSEQVADATFRNFAMGQNLLTLHGLYYTTYGGFWEWAPPCNHFRMPYFKQFKTFLKSSKRLSFLLSQGYHVCDVGIVYPVAAVEGGLDGNNSISTAFSLSPFLYNKAIDFDFIDFESIQNASIDGNRLKVSGESFKAIILPSMKTVRFAMLEKLLEFYRNGGIVICVGDLPIASDRCGREDHELDTIVEEIFKSGKNNYVVSSNEEVVKILDESFTRDFIYKNGIHEINPYILHRTIDKKEIYFVYGAEKESECFFRAFGNVSVWNPWTAERFKLQDIEVTEHGTIVKMPYSAKEAQIIVFDTEEIKYAIFQKFYPENIISLDTDWSFELKPTLQNMWGDFRLPAFDGFIGAEIRKTKYQIESDTSYDVTLGYGPQFMKVGPIAETADLQAIESDFLNNDLEALKKYDIKLYSYGNRYGIEGDPGHQGYHGLKGFITDEFIALGKPVPQPLKSHTLYYPEDKGNIYYLWTSVFANTNEVAKILTGTLKPEKVFINGELCVGNIASLKKGSNFILLKYSSAGRTYFILEKTQKHGFKQTYPLAMNWYRNHDIYNYDVYPFYSNLKGCYTFSSPPALNSMKIHAYGEIEVIVDGEIINTVLNDSCSDGLCSYTAIVKNPIETCSKVLINIKHLRSYYGGNAIPEPIEFTCGKGVITLGDWSQYEGLYSYSGGIIYSTTINLTEDQSKRRSILNLGKVISSAEVYVNGKFVAEKCAPSWEFDISDFTCEGENKIEVHVYNTLSNHYTTIPTNYRGSLKSGLIGPVTLML